MRTHAIKRNPDDALARQLDQQENIWADYDPARALAAVEKSAGILKRAGVDAAQLERDIDDDRTQNSTGRPA